MWNIGLELAKQRRERTIGEWRPAMLATLKPGQGSRQFGRYEAWAAADGVVWFRPDPVIGDDGRTYPCRPFPVLDDGLCVLRVS